MAKKKITVKEAINVLNTKYANTLGMLDDALDQIEHLENELAKKPKEVQVEVEKVVEVERKVEVPKEVVVTREVEVPGPERIVEVPGPERVVEVPVEVVKEVPVEVVITFNPVETKALFKNLKGTTSQIVAKATKSK